MIGCMDWIFCTILNVGVWLEVFHSTTLDAHRPVTAQANSIDLLWSTINKQQKTMNQLVQRIDSNPLQQLQWAARNNQLPANNARATIRPNQNRRAPVHQQRQYNYQVRRGRAANDVIDMIYTFLGPSLSPTAIIFAIRHHKKHNTMPLQLR